MERVLHGPSIAEAHLHGLHDYLTGRGWVITMPDYYGTDEDGRPTDPETRWRYAASYGGVVMNSVEDSTPCSLACGFGFEGGLSVDVSTAGNWRGCEAHPVAEHSLPVEEHYDEAADRWNDLDFTELGALLDRLEPAARALDARELIECLFFGPCGRDL
ncbi:hypothetical protein [Nocardia sp. NPDC059228]|uniref:hypothetical protein n=1 Tax=Nocardia sp. NPDC059228 TaxID=3346777 RepID=UPI0036746890